MEPYVSITIDESVGTIEFYHPQSNSLPSAILKELADTITSASINDDIKIIILRSGGDRAFCGGASFDELLEIRDAKSGKEFFLGFANVINAARKCPKFIIGRVQGKAVGGGVGMASATDYCIATQFASVKLSELAIGIGPFVVGPSIERKLGLSAFSQLTINATNWQTAQWAREKGLFTEVYDTVEEMDDAIEILAKKLVLSNLDSMKELKKIIWSGTDHWDELLMQRAEISGERVLSDFTRKTIEKLKKG